MLTAFATGWDESTVANIFFIDLWIPVHIPTKITMAGIRRDIIFCAPSALESATKIRPMYKRYTREIETRAIVVHTRASFLEK